MTQPTRLLEGDLDSFEHELLSSAGGDRGSERARARALAVFSVLGVELATSTAASAGTLGAASSAVGSAQGALSKITAGILVKWLGTGVVLGTATAGGAFALQKAARPAATPSLSVPVDAAPAKAEVATSPAPRTVEPHVDQSVNEGKVPSERREKQPGREDPEGVLAERVPREGASSGAFPVDSASTLGEELASLDRARRALGSGDVTSALRELSRYEARFPHGALADEATLLSVEARLDAGDSRGAHAAAARILDRNPTGPHARRLLTLFANKETR